MTSGRYLVPEKLATSKDGFTGNVFRLTTRNVIYLCTY